MKHSRTFSDFKTYMWTSKSLTAIRNSMAEHGYHEIIPAIMSTQLEAGALHSIAILSGLERMRVPSDKNRNTNIVVDNGNSYYLPFSHNFEKQQAVEFLEKTYGIVPCVRPLKDYERFTGKHLNTFYEVEVEMISDNKDSIMTFAEILLSDVAGFLDDEVTAGRLEDTKIGNRNRRSVTDAPFPRITFQEALHLVGAKCTRLIDLTQEEDEKLCKLFSSPFWIYDYPREVRDAVYHENSEGTYDTYDLMLPFGYGELATGGVRPKSGDAILRQSLEVLKESPNTLTYGHADWKSKRNIQSAGFGIGFERLLRFMSGSTTVLDFVQPHDQGPNRLI
nr:amino acid--tRNA ligase-related protein [Pseudomonas luteola]